MTTALELYDSLSRLSFSEAALAGLFNDIPTVLPTPRTLIGSFSDAQANLSNRYYTPRIAKYVFNIPAGVNNWTESYQIPDPPIQAGVGYYNTIHVATLNQADRSNWDIRAVAGNKNQTGAGIIKFYFVAMNDDPGDLPTGTIDYIAVRWYSNRLV